MSLDALFIQAWKTLFLSYEPMTNMSTSVMHFPTAFTYLSSTLSTITHIGEGSSDILGFLNRILAESAFNGFFKGFFLFTSETYMIRVLLAVHAEVGFTASAPDPELTHMLS